ncbi:DNA replication/repair protein RecF [Gemmatimonas sp. UBA7669]|uniref:DNA replication/repair protein RecF n=1 Tax=Gemmatimonas sp. UBA7669 TaxID=1946568 RepID=UPI0025BF9543|nr:DNA replication and repair protein RecF [Gemmatimonas sp. UBA7669]
MLAHLALRDYRNLASLDLTVPAAGLVVVGENGQGKTNLLEAVAYLALLRSFRGARDVDVVRFGAPAFHVRATLSAPARCHTVGVGFERASKRKRATLDGVEQTRLTQALGALPSVEFSPADVSLVAGGPGERRHYLDVMLALSSPAYLQALQQYRAALLRRNATLRALQLSGTRHAPADERVSVWEPALAESGGVVIAARQRFVAEHAEGYAALCAQIGERDLAHLRYQSVSSDAGAPGDHAAQQQALLAAMAAQRGNELRRGTTLVGPHRDDLVLQLGGRDLRTFGSAGQQRSAAIALRLLELAVLTRALGHAPLLLLDDPFAELDLGRAARVLDLLEAAGAAQVLLAVPREEDIPPAYTRLERRVMRGGVLG